MSEVITRKCNKCKELIEINLDNIDEVIYYKRVYYHKSCFVEKATKSAAKNISTASEWQKVLDNFSNIEKETKEVLRQSIGRDMLNNWILNHYDVDMVPSYFWQLVADLKNGKYKSKKCKPIYTDTLALMWKWGQNNLDKIYANNKNKRQGPSSDTERLNYDLAILLSHSSDYTKYVTRTKEEASEIATRVEKANKFDYEKIYKESKKQEAQRDILDLMNDIF